MMVLPRLEERGMIPVHPHMTRDRLRRHARGLGVIAHPLPLPLPRRPVLSLVVVAVVLGEADQCPSTRGTGRRARMRVETEEEGEIVRVRLGRRHLRSEEGEGDEVLIWCSGV